MDLHCDKFTHVQKYCCALVVHSRTPSKDEERTWLLMVLLEDWYLCLLLDLSLAQGKSPCGILPCMW